MRLYPGLVTCLLRDRVNRSGFACGASGPAVVGPAFADESAGDDDRVGEGDERVDDSGSHFGADVEFFESAVVPGVGAFHWPSPCCVQGCRFTFGCDFTVAAE